MRDRPAPRHETARELLRRAQEVLALYRKDGAGAHGPEPQALAELVRALHELRREAEDLDERPDALAT